MTAEQSDAAAPHPAPHPAHAPERFIGLDGLRGLAAIAVLIRHLPDQLGKGWFPASYLGVDLFFMLSGFVIAHAYERRLLGGMGALGFMKARFIRLWPLYMLGTAIGIGCYVFERWSNHWDVSGEALGAMALNALMLPALPSLSPDQTHPFPFNGPAWSLFYELVINLIFALIVLRLNARLLAVILCAGAAGLIATALHYGHLDTGANFETFFGGFGRVFFAFFAGVALFRLYRAFPPRPLRGWLSAWAPMALLAAALFVSSAMIPRDIYGPFAVIVLFPLIVWMSAATAPEGVAARLFAAAGVASYGVYILQGPIIRLSNLVLEEINGGRVSMFGALGAWGLSLSLIALALLLDHLYDAPARRGLARLARRLAPKPAAA